MKSVLLWGGVGIAIAAGIVMVLTFSTPSPESSESSESLGPDYSLEIPLEGATHVLEGTSVTYQSNPPTSGSHWANPLRDGVYDQEKPDEAVVHSLEHGRVWISYQPSLPQSAVDQLESIASKQARVILTPRTSNETAIALAVWQRLDTFQLLEDGQVDEQRILDFIERYRDTGPEFIPQMTGNRYE